MAPLLFAALFAIAAADVRASETTADSASSAAYVLACEGEADWRSSQTADWQALSSGLWLDSSASLRTGATGRIDLLFSDNAVTAIGPNQAYEVGTKKTNRRPVKAGFWNALAQLVSILGPTEDYGHVAGVRTIDELLAAGPPELSLLTPVNTRVLGPDIVFHWEGGAPGARGIVTIEKEDGSPLTKLEQEEDAPFLKTRLVNLLPGGKYRWTVLQEGAKTSAPALFEVLPADAAKKLRNECEDWTARGGALTPTGQHVLRGLFYARNDLKSDAVREFLLAQESSGNPDAYADLIRASEKGAPAR